MDIVSDQDKGLKEGFRYESLIGDRPYFRLLRLSAGSEEIQCELFTAFFDEPEDLIPYEALSYTWGGLYKTRSIMLNEEPFTVTANLWSALLHLRRETSDRILWIDAICIDQLNKKEQTHQIRQMKDIHRKAEMVLIWLGEASYRTDRLFQDLRRMNQKSRNIACSSWPRDDERWMELWRSSRSDGVQDDIDTMDEQYTAVACLFRHPWFTRVWILQEAALSQRATVVCGDSVLPVRTFTLIPSIFKINVSALQQAVLDILPSPFRPRSWWASSQSLRVLLYKFRDSKASIARDRLYALVSLCSDADEHLTSMMDYEMQESEVVKRTMTHIFGLAPADFNVHLWKRWTLKQLLPQLGQIDWAYYEGLKYSQAALKYVFAWIQLHQVPHEPREGLQWDEIHWWQANQRSAEFRLIRMVLNYHKLTCVGNPHLIKGIGQLLQSLESLELEVLEDVSLVTDENTMSSIFRQTIAPLRRCGVEPRIDLKSLRICSPEESLAWAVYITLFGAACGSQVLESLEELVLIDALTAYGCNRVDSPSYPCICKRIDGSVLSISSSTSPVVDVKIGSIGMLQEVFLNIDRLRHRDMEVKIRGASRVLWARLVLARSLPSYQDYNIPNRSATLEVKEVCQAWQGISSFRVYLLAKDWIKSVLSVYELATVPPVREKFDANLANLWVLQCGSKSELSFSDLAVSTRMYHGAYIGILDADEMAHHVSGRVPNTLDSRVCPRNFVTLVNEPMCDNALFTCLMELWIEEYQATPFRISRAAASRIAGPSLKRRMRI